jgi:hypothetical protein
VDELPADRLASLACAIGAPAVVVVAAAGDALADATLDAAELLDVEMH